MKKVYLLLMMVSWSTVMFAQLDLRSVYVAAGGAFSNPDDYVTIKKINPEDYSAEVFDVIYTQAVTDLLVFEDKMYVAAMDSLVAYDLVLGTRIAAIAIANTNKLSMVNNHLWLSRQTGSNGVPADGIYLKVYDPNDLTFIDDIEGIDADAAFVSSSNDSIYVTVPGDWAATTGKIAILDMDTYSLQRTLDLGAEAVGIFNIYHHNNHLWMVCKTPYMGTIGSFVDFDPSIGNYFIFTQEAAFGFGVGMDVENDRSFLLYNNQIAYYTFSDQTFTAVAPDPGSASWISYASGAFEKVSNTIWANYTDFYSSGTCMVYDLSGNELAAMEVGISPEAMGFHYQDATGVNSTQQVASVHVFPNPVVDRLTISGTDITNGLLLNSNGKVISRFNGNQTIDMSNVPEGLYLLRFVVNGEIITKKIIKQ